MASKYWLLHSNPKVWDTYSELNTYSYGEWSINKKDIKLFSPGDKFLLYVSGNQYPGPGIYAAGEINSSPILKHNDQTRTIFDKSKTNKNEKSNQVKLNYTTKSHNNPLTRKEILSYEFLNELDGPYNFFYNPQGIISKQISTQVYNALFKQLESHIENTKLENENILKEITDETILNTEISSLIKVRIGQSKIREKLMLKEKKCKLCQIDNPELLIASHIKPWAECCDAKEKLDLNNLFLLCKGHDALFDKFLISFKDNGEIIISKRIKKAKYLKDLNINLDKKYKIENGNIPYLRYHRNKLKS